MAGRCGRRAWRCRAGRHDARLARRSRGPSTDDGAEDRRLTVDRPVDRPRDRPAAPPGRRREAASPPDRRPSDPPPTDGEAGHADHRCERRRARHPAHPHRAVGHRLARRPRPRDESPSAGAGRPGIAHPGRTQPDARHPPRHLHRRCRRGQAGPSRLREGNPLIPPAKWTDATFVTHPGAARRALPGLGSRIAVVDGPDVPREVAIPEGGVTVGSGPECGLRLSDKRVSRNHVHIAADGDGFRVRDLGSTNGSFLDGARLDDALLPAGTTLLVGKSALRLLGAERYQVVPASTRERFGDLLGKSLPMREVFGVLERVVDAEASVLIEGETGTGKEVVARALHAEGRRASSPFVALDCGAIAPNLVESEFFGHVRGAFTGAVDTRPGAFERAHGGTLFLDELGELPPELQPKLLRVLETREVRKVGAAESRRVDVRVVAGTNRDLQEMVDEGTFRADLYYRLAVVHVLLPPLRARIEDLPVLIEKFLRDGAAASPGAIDGPNLELLAGHAWPGNVRELRNVLQRALACAGAPGMRFCDLPIHIGGRPRAGRREAPAEAAKVDLDVPFSDAKERLVDGFERAYLTALLGATEGNVAEASRRSGLNRRHLYDLLKKHGLRA
ncbi:MAG: sigma 54-dependent Fis family transcriptional regulator [Myxococcales bacterium]|nr:sigma 54-dependent Fis family transcriptional regulator [Myxococcales bacterium]